MKTILTIAGMALGISVYYAIRSANENAWESFLTSAELIAPDELPRLESASGKIPEAIIPKLLSLPEIRSVSPQSAAFVSAQSGERDLGTIEVLGVDFTGGGKRNEKLERSDAMTLLREPAAVVSTSLHERLAGGRLAFLLNGTSAPVTIAGVLPNDGLAKAYGGQIALMDIAQFQTLFHSTGSVDTLFLDLVPPATKESVGSKLRDILPPQIAVAEPNSNAGYARRMTEAFRLNLTFLSGISLFVALFLVYNTTGYSTMKRRGELSTLRSLGASAKDIFIFLSLESVFLGLVAAVIGIALGQLLAYGAVKLVSASFSTLYLPVRVTTVPLQPSLIWQCLLLGPALALAGSAFPIVDVCRLSPRATHAYQQSEADFVRWRPLTGVLGVALLLGSALFAQRSLLERTIYAGFISPALLLLAVIFLSPLLISFGLRSAKRILLPLFGPELLLACDHILTTLRRSAMAVTAMIIATGMFIGVSTMILSFRKTVEDWIFHVTKADVYVSTVARVAGPASGYLPDEVVQYLVSHPSVEDYDWLMGTKVRIGEREARVNGVRFETIGRHDRLLLQTPMSSSDLESMLQRPGVALISETFAVRNHMKAGDKLLLPGLQETATLTVGNVYFDYSSDQGVVLIPDSLFSSLYAEKRKHGISLYLKPGVDPDSIQNDIHKEFPNLHLGIRSNKTLRTEVLRVFDDTFKITYALQAIALLISALTVVNTVLMLMLERKREFAVFRAIGASRWSLARMVGYESLLLGVSAAVGAVVLGVILALILVFVINQFFFGWSIRFLLPLTQIATTVLLLVGLAFVAGLIPGLQVARRLNGSALSYE